MGTILKTHLLRVIIKLVNKDGIPDVGTQSYRETGNEESLGSFTLTAMEGQDFHASALRAFEGYSLYQTADPRSLVDVLKKPYQVGQTLDLTSPMQRVLLNVLRKLSKRMVPSVSKCGPLNLIA